MNIIRETYHLLKVYSRRIKLSCLCLLAGLFPLQVLSAQQPYISEVLSSNTSWNYDKDFGAYSDWIEIHNPGSSPVDLNGWFLSDKRDDPGKWQIPEQTIIAPDGYLLFWADDHNLRPGDTAYVEFTELEQETVEEYHLNFKINRDREVVYLFNSEKELIDSLKLELQQRNFSFGRKPGEKGEGVFLSEPTPLAENSSSWSATFLQSGKVSFSLESGLYSGPQVLELDALAPGAVIRFTTDGSEPHFSSSIYTGPIQLNYSQVVKAKLYEEDKLPGEVVTASYILNKSTSLPILSISTDHRNLWGFDFGLYQNNYKNREIFAHLDYFSSSGEHAFAIGAGLQLFGSQIFKFDQKPFSVYFRNRYGQDSLHYKLFPGREQEAFTSLVLRNGGNDSNLTMIRDGLGAVLIENRLDMEYQSYQPVVVYMNGEYWGIFNFREKLNEEYLAGNHPVNPDHLDLLEDSLQVNNGDANDYKRLLEFLENNDLENQVNYEKLATYIDLENFRDYMIYKLYGGYKQWQVNNKYWREREGGSRWRWIVFDMEHSFAGPGGLPPGENAFIHALEPTSYQWYTRVFRELMENEGFRNEFLQVTAVYLSTLYSADRVLHIVDSLSAAIYDEMDDHILRWSSPYSMQAWQQNLGLLRDFAMGRTSSMFTNLLDYFELPDSSRLYLKKSEGGSVMIATAYLQHKDSASYLLLDSIPLKLEAFSEPGYRFSGWSNGSMEPVLNLRLSGDSTILATFTADASFLLPDTIKNTVILEDNSQPWLSKGDLVIPEGDSLILGKGVEIRMAPGASIFNYGYLEVAGSQGQVVRIAVNNSLAGRTYKKEEKWGSILFLSSDSCSMQYLVMEDASSGKDGDYMKGAITIRNSTVSMTGIQISGVANPVYAYRSKVLIDSCNFSSNGTGDLIHLKACFSPVISNCILTGNYYEDTDAIDLDSVRDARVEDNYIHSFFGYNSDGIDLGEHSTGIEIISNRIFSITDKGISVGQGSEVEARQNIIVDCNQGFGIKDFNSFAYINQNTLYANRTGVACFEKNTGNGGGSARIENTIIAASLEQSVYVDELSALTVTYSLSDNDSLVGYNNLFADPEFKNAGNLYFYKGEASPCNDAGTPNQQDPDGSRADIGAFFEADMPSGVLRITEINYNSHPTFNTGDWLEIFNPGPGSVDLTSWALRGEDASKEYYFGDLQLEEGAFLVLAESKDSIQILHAPIGQITGDMNFGLSSEGELLRLYDASKRLVNSVAYGTSFPWPDGPLGKGASLELFTGEQDNSKPENWHSSYLGGGTPGTVNSESNYPAGLYINEIMAKNDNYQSDEAGEYDDWFEIYNSNDFEVDLGGLQLIKGTDDPKFYMIPFFEEVTLIPAKGFLRFWADKDPEQGALHREFNLPASGGSLGIGQFISKELHITDRMDFPSLEADQAFGRFPDGSTELALLNPSPGSSNLLLGRKDQVNLDEAFLLYPNPARDLLFLSSTAHLEKPSVKIIAMDGRIIKQLSISTFPHEITLGDMDAGLYVICIMEGNRELYRQIVVKYV